MTSEKLRNPLLLFLAAFIWGTAFVAQSVGMDYIGPFTMNCVRSLIGALVLLPVALISGKREARKGVSAGRSKKMLLLGGLACGVVLCLATNLQQIGIQHTTVGKAGFITAFYIVLVPVFGIFLKKRTNFVVWLSVALALLGLYLLCMDGDFTLSWGDLMCLLCAIVFSWHILLVDYLSPRVNGIKLSCLQFLVSGLISAVPMLLFEKPAVSSILQAYIPVLYTGVMSSGVAYTLQILGQRNVHPTLACLIMSLESVISVLAGWVILHQSLSLREIAGCIIMFAAIILVQCFGQKTKKEPSGAPLS